MGLLTGLIKGIGTNIKTSKEQCYNKGIKHERKLYSDVCRDCKMYELIKEHQKNV